MLINKINSEYLSSIHDLLLFLTADPKVRAADLICPICLNFASYLHVKCLMGSSGRDTTAGMGIGACN